MIGILCIRWGERRSPRITLLCCVVFVVIISVLAVIHGLSIHLTEKDVGWFHRSRKLWATVPVWQSQGREASSQTDPVLGHLRTSSVLAEQRPGVNVSSKCNEWKPSKKQGLGGAGARGPRVKLMLTHLMEKWTFVDIITTPSQGIKTLLVS